MHTWLERNQCRIFFAPDAFCVKISFLEGTFFLLQTSFFCTRHAYWKIGFSHKRSNCSSRAVAKMSVEISVCSDKVASSYTRNENVLKKLVCSLVLRIWLFLIMTSGFFFQRHSTIGGCIDKKSIKPRDSRPTIIWSGMTTW